MPDYPYRSKTRHSCVRPGRWLQLNFKFGVLNKIKKNDILQLGPVAVRRKERLEQALALLQVQGRIVVSQECGTMFVFKFQRYGI
ncbi:hypothetical protein GCM10027295_13990 [Pseudaeromonas pectinilytica]